MATSLSKAVEKESQRSGPTNELAFNALATHCLPGILLLEAWLSYFPAK